MSKGTFDTRVVGAGFYRVMHLPSGKLFLGTSSGVKAALSHLGKQLADGTHPHKGLSKLYAGENDFQVLVEVAPDIKEAKLMEKQYRAEVVRKYLLLN